MRIQQKIKSKSQLRNQTGLIDVDLNDLFNVCPYDIEELKSPSRKRELVIWRHLAILIMYIDKNTFFIQEECEEYFGRKHGTFNQVKKNIHLKDYQVRIIEIVENATKKEVKEKKTPLEIFFKCLYESRTLSDYEKVKSYAIKNIQVEELREIIDIYKQLYPNKI